MSSVVKISPGTLVLALAGRDKGSVFVAVESHDGWVFIADGKSRKLGKPKRKNLRHISPVNAKIELSGLTDKKLRSLLREYQPNTNAQQSNGDTTVHLIRKGD